MKKLFVILAIIVLLGGCSSKSENKAENGSSSVLDGLDGYEDVFTEKDFIMFSAKILCLPVNNPHATAGEIDAVAKEMLDQAGISEEEFDVYQKNIEINSEKKNELSFKVVGKMSDFCGVRNGGLGAKD